MIQASLYNKSTRYNAKFLDNRDKPRYDKIDSKNWQIKKALYEEPRWQLEFLKTYNTIVEYSNTAHCLWTNPIFYPTTKRLRWKDYASWL